MNELETSLDTSLSTMEMTRFEVYPLLTYYRQVV